ncbi:MAG: cobalt-zinc-cadmium efflux system outer membrane protein [Burkholderiaceae bacterium]|jgi:cobalt-zinc-cadmium efflux system outer membrane protein
MTPILWRTLVASAALSASSALATEPLGIAALPQSAVHYPLLLPTAAVRPLIDQTPSVAAARAGLAVARQDAGLLTDSPYEWTAKVTTQRRTVDTGARYGEWNAGIERTLRLPDKARADGSLAQATLDEAKARHGEALHDMTRDLLGLWLDWAHAEQGQALSLRHLQASQENLRIVEKRVKAGDAARLDASLARAELAEQQRASIEVKTAVAVAWAHLQARFPGFDRDLSAFPAALPLVGDGSLWRARILDQSDELKTAEAQMQKMQARGARAHAEKIPDPTVGLFTASEVGGRERLTGIMFSIPIPGSQRTRHADRSVHADEMSRQEVASKKRQLDAVIGAGFARTQGAFEGWQIAETGAADMQDNARLMARAYALGEADLQALLSARRQATTAAQNALSAKVAASRSYYGLLVDAHLIWDMAHE